MPAPAAAAAKPKAANREPRLSFLTEGAIGAGAGFASRSLVHTPANNVKLAMTRASLEPPTIANTVRRMVQHDGLAALWRRNMINVVDVTPHTAIAFIARDRLQRAMAPEAAAAGMAPSPSSLHYFAAGGGAGAIETMVLHPRTAARFWLSKQRTHFKANAPPTLRGDLIPAARDMIAKEGPLSLYRLAGPYALSTAMYRALSMGLYDTVRLGSSSANPSKRYPMSGFLSDVMRGTVASGIASAVVYPVWMVGRRTTLQYLNTADAAAAEAITAMGTLRSLLRTEGLVSLYRGMIMAGGNYGLAIGSLGGGVALASYDALRRWYTQDSLAAAE